MVAQRRSEPTEDEHTSVGRGGQGHGLGRRKGGLRGRGRGKARVARASAAKSAVRRHLVGPAGGKQGPETASASAAAPVSEIQAAAAAAREARQPGIAAAAAAAAAPQVLRLSLPQLPLCVYFLRLSPCCLRRWQDACT